MNKESRAAKMLQALSLKDQRTLKQLDLPKHESTKGLTIREQHLAIKGFNEVVTTEIPLATGLDFQPMPHPTQHLLKKSTKPLLPESQCYAPLSLEYGNNFDDKVNDGKPQTIYKQEIPLATGLEFQPMPHTTQHLLKKSTKPLLPESQCYAPLSLEYGNNFDDKVNDGKPQTILLNVTKRNEEPQTVYNDHQRPQVSSNTTAIDEITSESVLITVESDIDCLLNQTSSNDSSLNVTCSSAAEEGFVSELSYSNLDSSFSHSQVKSSTSVQSTETAENPINIVLQSKEISVDDDHRNIRIGSPETRQETNEYEEPEPDEPNDIIDPIAGNKMKRRRRYDRKNFCIFCESTYSNFRRHMLRMHKKEEPVAQYLALLECCPEESKKQREKILADLRRKGNFIHNQGLLKDPVKRVTHASELLPERRPPSNSKKSSEDFVTCMYCFNLVSKKSFYKHVPSCKENPKNKIVGERDEENISENDTERQMKCSNFSKRYGIDIRPVSVEVSKTMREKIIPTLIKDDVGKLAVSDPLILALANDFLSSHQMAKDKYSVTRKMRDAALLVKKVKEYDNSVLTLKDCFNPLLANTVIRAVQELCGCNMESGEVKIIGMPARLSWIINEGGRRVIDDIICDEKKPENERHLAQKRVDDFLCVFRRRWKYAISSNAEKSRKTKRMEKPPIIPPDEDIIQFSRFLIDQENKCYDKLKSSVNIENYERMCKLTIAHIITLNRRRPAEAAQGTLNMYLNRGKESYVSPSIIQSLTSEELRANEELNLYVVPGKLVHQVPVLLTGNMQRNIDLIISCRKGLGIPSQNNYLFARPALDTPFVGSSIMAELRRECPNLLKPNFMTATGLRHHIASVAQVEGEQFTESLCTFMGHSKEVHKRNYRLPSNILHKGIVGKAMLRYEKAATKDHSEPSTSSLTFPSPTENEEEIVSDNGSSISFSDHEIKKQKIGKKKREKRRWSEDEKAIIVKEFRTFLKKNKNPGLKLCSSIIEKYPQLSGRTPMQINIFIDNLNRGKLKFSANLKNLIS